MMPSPREETLLDVQHPEFFMGRRAVRLGSDLHELADRIKNGDPTVGWEGDPRLTLARYDDPKTGTQFELWRLEHDGEYRIVARLAGLNPNPSDITRQLVERDFRRGCDIKDMVDRHNSQVQAQKDRSTQEKLSAGAEKLRWALKRDMGVRTQWGINRKEKVA